MRSSSRVLSLAILTAAASALSFAGSATAAEPRLLPAEHSRVSLAQATDRFCATRFVSGAGIAHQTYTAPADGFVTARLAGDSLSEWDLGVLDASSRRALNGSAAFGALELATATVRKGQAVRIQTCRRSGARTLGLSVQFTAATLGDSEGKVKLVRIKLEKAADHETLRSLDLDTTDHGTGSHQDAILYTASEERALQSSGLGYTVRIADVDAHDRANRAVERRAASSARARAYYARATPGGRTTYRTLPEHQQDMQRMVEQNPTVARPFRVGFTIEGRPIDGVEIAQDVARTDDGRPQFVMVGTHHAREWPANESTIEWGLQLLDDWNAPAGNAERKAIVAGARTFVIPILNVDGFDATIRSELTDPTLADPSDSDTTSGSQSVGTGAYKRKNCRAENAGRQQIPCIARTRTDSAEAETDMGIDLNRNYGVEWGGPGTSSAQDDLTFHGPAPFSEPETEAFRRWLRTLQPAVLITNHTFTGLILRPPGTSDFGPTPDEDNMRAIGDAMAQEVDYISQYSYQLYDTTGTTDDYLYDGLNSYSYTPEIGKEEFHPAYTTGFVPEWDGTASGEGGLRESFTIAGRAVLEDRFHSVLAGTAPAGRTLRITKPFSYTTSTRPDDDGADLQPGAPAKGSRIEEVRASTLVVSPNGTFEWDVNPSSQPRFNGTTAWRLTCEDGAGNVLEARDVFVARGQRVNLALSCGATATAPAPATTTPAGETCTDPNGFRSVSVTRTGRSLRISFTKRTRNAVTVDVFQTAKGRKIVSDKRVARFRNRQRSFTWNGRKTIGNKARVARGVYFVRFRVTDAAKKIDTRRIVVAKRANGRFYKKGKFVLENSCP